MTINTVNQTLIRQLGGVAEYFDDIPDQFSFTSQIDVPVSSPVTSNAITVAGMDAAATADITVVGGTYNINGGAFTSTPGTVQNGDQVRTQHTSSSSNSTQESSTVTINGISATFNSVTVEAAGQFDPSHAFVDVDALGYSTGTSWNSNSVINGDNVQKDELTFARGRIDISETQAVPGKTQSYRGRTFQGGVDCGAFRGFPSSRTLLDKPFYQYQWKTYFPAGFSFVANATDSVKYMAFNTYPFSSARLWIKIGNTNRRFKVEDEGYPGNNYFFGPSPTVEYDVWQTWTMQINCSTTPGVARFQMWGSGGALGTGTKLTDSWTDQPNSPTAGLTVSPGGPSAKEITWRIFDYWNSNGSTIPPSQEFFMDDIIVTDSDNPLNFINGLPQVY